ncbi:putative exonuclease [Armadillidium nasatum]|uniref:Putative exonuclease n=1 Tax=Armadillidium nasatum TaxID=96803 RepID=A0A5N5SVA2_9CRUS|nr:putative exonuclease [Armadillidium nasatum]
MVRFAEYIKYVSAKSENQENGIVDSLSVEDFKVKPREKNKPKLVLEPRGERSLLCADRALRVPLTFNCIQSLILQALLGTKAPQSPLWCNLFNRKFISNITVVIVDGWDLSDLNLISSDGDEPPEKKRKGFEGSCSSLTDSDLSQPAEENLLEIVQESLPYSSSCFPLKFEVAPPTKEPSVELFSSIPMSSNIVKALKEKYKSLRRAARCKVVFPIACEEDEEPILKEKFTSIVEDHKDQFNRVDLLLSVTGKWQNIIILWDWKELYQGKIQHSLPLHSHYEKVTRDSPMFGIDCEMCRTVVGIELTRVSVVDEKLNVIYSSFVKPSNQIVDFLTRYSGITPDHLVDVTTSVVQVQQKLRKILPKDCILVGHGIDNDLIALKLLHPYLIDTSIIYNLSRNPYTKPSLKLLAKLFLNKDIQVGDVKGHDPSEDAAASLELALLKLRNNTSFGDLNKGGELPCSKIGFMKTVRNRRKDKISSFYSAKNAFGENYGSNVPKIIRLEVDSK